MIRSPVLARLAGLTGRSLSACARENASVTGEIVADTGCVTVSGETSADDPPLAAASCNTEVVTISGALALGTGSGLRFFTFILDEGLSTSGSNRNVPCRESGFLAPREASAGGVYPEWNNSKSSESSCRESMRESREAERCGGCSSLRNLDGFSILLRYESITSRKLLTDEVDCGARLSMLTFGGMAGGGGAFSEIDRFLLLKNEEGFLFNETGGWETFAGPSFWCCDVSLWLFDWLRLTLGGSAACGGSTAGKRVEDPPKTRLKNPGFSL